MRYHLTEVCAEVEWNTALLTNITSGAEISIPAIETEKDILNIHGIIQNTVN